MIWLFYCYFCVVGANSFISPKTNERLAGKWTTMNESMYFPVEHGDFPMGNQKVTLKQLVYRLGEFGSTSGCACEGNILPLNF